MQTVLILDGESQSSTKKAVDGMACITIAVDTPAKARHLLMNLQIDLFVCDLETPEFDLDALLASATVCNPNLRLMLTGTAISQRYAAQLVQAGRAMLFLPKPWQPMTAKHTINTLLASERPKLSVVRRGAGAAGADSAAHGAPRFRIKGRTPPPEAETPREEGHPRFRIKGKPLPPEPEEPKEEAPRLRFRSTVKVAPSVTAAQGVAEHGRYRIDEIIGEGGTGRVCKAYDMLLDMVVAIKLLNPDLIRDEEAIAALKAETRISLSLQNENIVRIYNLERRGPNYILIMEYIKGDSLAKLLQEFPGGLALDFVTQLMQVVTNALGYAHRRGVLHKDITPGNILLTDDGIVKVIDFGISDQVKHQRDSNGDDFVVGTPAYMSPEQIRGETLDSRTDIYSLGVLITQLLTGHTIEADATDYQALAFHPHPPIQGLPEVLTPILETATAFSPADRWQTMEEFGAVFVRAASSLLTAGQ